MQSPAKGLSVICAFCCPLAGDSPMGASRDVAGRNPPGLRWLGIKRLNLDVRKPSGERAKIAGGVAGEYDGWSMFCRGRGDEGIDCIGRSSFGLSEK